MGARGVRVTVEVVYSTSGERRLSSVEVALKLSRTLRGGAVDKGADGDWISAIPRGIIRFEAALGRIIHAPREMHDRA